MTRETKIGLLTGLGVIILIGVLLSQYLGAPGSGGHPANLMSLGESYRQRQLAPVTVDPTVKPESTMLAGVDGSAAATAAPAPASAGEAAIAHLPTGDDSASSAAAPVSAAPVTAAAEPVTAQPAGPIIAGPGTDSPAMPPLQLGQTGSTNTNIERAIYVPVDPNNPQASAAPPAAAPTSPANDVPTGTFYTVAKGDSLTVISKRFYRSATPSDFAKIVAANPAVLKDEKTSLQIGNKLLIPDAPKPVAVTPAMPQIPATVGPTTSDTLVLRPDNTGAAGASNTSKAPAAPKAIAAKATIYTVQAGDTLGKIAKRFLGTSSSSAIKRIAKANKLESADDLEVGMTLKIPAKATS